MDANTLHLLLNHYPMFVSFLGTVLFVIGWWRKSDRFMRVGLWIFLIVSILIFPVYVTGEITGAGDVGHGVFAEAINQHKQSARAAFFAGELAGVVSLIGLILFWRKRQVSKWIIYVILILSLASTAIITQTTLKGRHIKFSFAEPNVQQQTNIQK